MSLHRYAAKPNCEGGGCCGRTISGGKTIHESESSRVLDGTIEPWSLARCYTKDGLIAPRRSSATLLQPTRGDGVAEAVTEGVAEGMAEATQTLRAHLEAEDTQTLHGHLEFNASSVASPLLG